ncbi:hypothetical protein DFH08DRAFT_1043922 [Mycena albidolilacea]|uniref:Steroid 5-alpha reductase C-terminal domain-containing protein n=1 Tax=Mycena albidolilacea TaxID=1033008 RepID=A0AAD6Z928_9AGAR|nr:hypothetical protein DFH08DRAFT_1043922 [Mycena albidolilacea]
MMFIQGRAVKALAAIGVRASNALVTAGPGLAGFGHVLALLTGMYVIAGIRHAIRSKSLAYWALFTSDNYCSTGSSLGIAVQHSRHGPYAHFITASHSWQVHRVHWMEAVGRQNSILGRFTECIGWKQWAGLALFVIRISMEMIAEDSRKKFRKDPKNKGKIDDTGLWSVVSHPNYLGFLLGRTGISLVTVSSRTPLSNLRSLSLGGVPEISGYMATKYDAQQMEYKKRVPNALLPGLY